MAAAGDKARFYLERQVPELQEFSRKNLFSRSEIAAITSKRSEFEHAVNTHDSKPGDYARYATYEMNLDSLRKERCESRGVKGLLYNGPRTIFSILERGTRRFPGDTRLWMQYIEYCKKQEANRKLAKAFTSILRLQPREWKLWVLAAKYYAEQQGDIGTARSYLQRGLRFCRDERSLYTTYLRLELTHLTKLAARRKLLGLDGKQVEKPTEDENMIALPTITAEDINPEINKGLEEVDVAALERLAAAPALSGAIPCAIFDAAMKEFQDDLVLANDMFQAVASFPAVPSTTRVLAHVLSHMRATDAFSVETSVCDSRSQLFGVDPHSVEFPSALGRSLAILRNAFSQLQDTNQSRLAEESVALLLPYLADTEEHEDDIRLVLEASIKRYLSHLARSVHAPTSSEQAHLKRLMERLKADGRKADVSTLRQIASSST